LKPAGTRASGAGLDRRAGLGAVALAVVTPVDRLVGDLEGPAGRGLLEVELDRSGDISPRCRAALPTTAPEERLEDVRDRSEGVEVRAVATRAEAVMTVAVIGRPAVCVREDLVGLGALLELGLGFGVVGVDIGVELAREATEGLLDLAGVRVSTDAEDFVGIALHLYPSA